jgi:hypothetical protein
MVAVPAEPVEVAVQADSVKAESETGSSVWVPAGLAL